MVKKFIFILGGQGVVKVVSYPFPKQVSSYQYTDIFTLNKSAIVSDVLKLSIHFLSLKKMKVGENNLPITALNSLLKNEMTFKLIYHQDVKKIDLAKIDSRSKTIKREPLKNA